MVEISRRLKTVLLYLVILGALILIATLLKSQTVPYWFQVSNGDTTCQAQTAATSPFRFDWLCKNGGGTLAGAYTANATTPPSDVLTIGLNGPENAAGTAGGAGVLCLIAVNMTANAYTVGSFGSLAAGSVAWQCNGQAVGSLSITPAASLIIKKKRNQ
jgi:hypothetical protein